jgi:predicted AlkP superfamily phosphohydrolase/phosphomutase
MPFDLLSTAGPVGILAIFLGFLLKVQNDKDKKQAENYQNLVNDVMNKSEERESKLMVQLDKYNSSLKEISDNIKNIPIMQKDIEILKNKIN